MHPHKQRGSLGEEGGPHPHEYEGTWWVGNLFSIVQLTMFAERICCWSQSVRCGLMHEAFLFAFFRWGNFVLCLGETALATQRNQGTQNTRETEQECNWNSQQKWIEDQV